MMTVGTVVEAVEAEYIPRSQWHNQVGVPLKTRIQEKGGGVVAKGGGVSF